jgi:hypothetical protein
LSDKVEREVEETAELCARAVCVPFFSASFDFQEERQFTA